MAERAENALEISRTAGFDRRRRTGRERWCLGHLVHTARLARLSFRAKKRRANQVPQSPPFSPSSSPPIEPGQPRYLQGMLCTLRHPVAPMGALVADRQSRRNLDCILIESRTLRLRRDFRSVTRAPIGATGLRSVQSVPWRYCGSPGSVGGDNLSENSSH